MTSPTKNTENNDAALHFEEAFDQLTALIDQLETGDVSLEESMSLFERGRNLIALCEEKLNAAELRVTQLNATGTNAATSTDE